MSPSPQTRASRSPRLGRSGPRSKKGCLTCRKRKVRCDEARPACQNCSRLRIGCQFPQPDASSPAPATAPQSSQDMSVDDVHGQTPPSRRSSRVVAGSDTNLIDCSLAFDDICSPLPILPPVVTTHASWGHSQPLTLELPAVTAALPTALGEEQSASKDQLWAYFLCIDSPPRLVPLLDQTWPSDRQTICHMAETFPPLTSAICAFTDAHQSRIDETNPDLAPDWYSKATHGVQQECSGDIEDDYRLQQLLATMLLLVFVEVMFPSLSNTEPPHFNLRSLHSLLHRYQTHFWNWRGTAKRLVVWLRLFDHKALFAGRDISATDQSSRLCGFDSSLQHASVNGGALLHMAGYVVDSNGIDDITTALTPTGPSDALFSAMNQAPFVFYLVTQRIKDSISLMNRWNRARGSLDNEIEVLQMGKHIDTVLAAHWANQPALLDHYLADEMLESLQPPVARRMASCIRLYRADYFAHIIYLHRVAFPVFAMEDKVANAIREVLQLATLEVAVSDSSNKPQEQLRTDGGSISDGELPSPVNSTPRAAVPEWPAEPLSSSWIWPLFMVAVEGTADQRAWVEAEFSRMAAATGTADYALAPSASRILHTLTDTVQRCGAGTDYRMVQMELFGNQLHII